MRAVARDFFMGFGNIFKKPRTVVYPKEKIIIPEESRGLPRLKLDPDYLDVVCNGCGDCEKVCPEKCIKIKKGIDENGKEYLEEFFLNISMCIFCANCVNVCKFNAIEMTYRHQFAERKKQNFIMEKLDLVKQSEYSIRDFWNE